MRIALVAPPFIAVPPARYGGTELFIAHLAEYLHRRGHEVIVYANGESDLPCEVRSLYPTSEWPIRGEIAASLKDLDHTAWAVSDAARSADVIHLNNAAGLALERFVRAPFVYTMHHPHEEVLTRFYADHPRVVYVAISRFQRAAEPMPRMTTIHHGIELERYSLAARKQDYLAFLGRMAPSKAPHLAIEVAQKAGIPLKLAGEIQPIYRDYWESQVAPRIDGRFVEYVGEADHRAKCELLAPARALLFPIQRDEPFGLVMIEAMACGTPVLALRAGSVPEIVEDGASGYVCDDTDQMADRARTLAIPAESCRQHVARHFTLDAMGQRYEAVYRRVIGERVTARRKAESVAETLDEAVGSISRTA